MMPNNYTATNIFKFTFFIAFIDIILFSLNRLLIYYNVIDAKYKA